jgi:hypothetical protein
MASNITGPKRTSMTLQFKNAAASSSGRVHIVRSSGKWIVKIEGARRARSVRSTRQSAMKCARSLKTSHRIIIHKDDGTIQANIGK